MSPDCPQNVGVSSVLLLLIGPNRAKPTTYVLVPCTVRTKTTRYACFFAFSRRVPISLPYLGHQVRPRRTNQKLGVFSTRVLYNTYRYVRVVCSFFVWVLFFFSARVSTSIFFFVFLSTMVDGGTLCPSTSISHRGATLLFFTFFFTFVRCVPTTFCLCRTSGIHSHFFFFRRRTFKFPGVRFAELLQPGPAQKQIGLQ